MIVRTLTYIVAALLLAPLIASATPRVYLAQIDRAQWRVSISEQACHLSHQIPFFGSVQITQGGPSSPTLTIVTDNPPVEGGIAELISRYPAHWQDSRDTLLQTTRIHPDTRVFRFSQFAARRILSELEQGRIVALRFSSWWHEGTAEVAISNVGFRHALEQHLDCVMALREQPLQQAPAPLDPLVEMGYQEIPFSGDDENGDDEAAQDSLPAATTMQNPQTTDEDPQPTELQGPNQHVILFDAATADLAPSARASLRALADSLRNDPSWNTVTATAYSDTSGTMRHNQELAQRRAEAVRNYLAQVGIPSNRIQMRAFVATLAPEHDFSGDEAPLNRRVVLAINQ